MNLQPAQPQLMDQRLLVYALQKPRSEKTVDLNRRADDAVPGLLQLRRDRRKRRLLLKFVHLLTLSLFPLCPSCTWCPLWLLFPLLLLRAFGGLELHAAELLQPQDGEADEHAAQDP